MNNNLSIQVVKNLQVIVDIEESSNITTLEVPDIKTVNEIETTSRSTHILLHIIAIIKLQTATNFTKL